MPRKRNALARLLEKYEKRFPNDSVLFRAKDSLQKILEKKLGDDDCGVYLFSLTRSGRYKPQYIGKAGTWERGKGLKKQGLLKRIREGKRRDPMTNQRLAGEAFLRGKLEANPGQAVRIRWFITLRGKHGILPAAAEAELFQAFFDDHGDLPEWNLSF